MIRTNKCDSLSRVPCLPPPFAALVRRLSAVPSLPSDEQSMQNPILPPELIVEILLKLPVSSLVRLKCVCKSWLSLISDPNFAKSHYDLSTKPTYRFLITSMYGCNVKSIDIESSLHDHTLTRNHPLPHPLSPEQFAFPDDYYSDSKRISIFGSCRGFLLLHWERGSLLVWNPSTGVTKLISYSHVKEMYYHFLYGFWHDASTDDYLVILIPMSGHPSKDWKTHIEIFSFKTNSWNQIEGFKFPYWLQICDTEAGLLLNGALHWLVFSCDIGKKVIIAFDLVQMSLLEIPISDDIDMELNSGSILYLLRLLGDCLCLCPCDGDVAAETWMMTKYKVQSSWTKSFVLPAYSNIHNLVPMCSTKSDGFFVSNSRGGLMKYNNRGILIEHTTFGPEFETHYVQQYAIYRESLLSLPGDLMEASEDDQL